MFVVVSGEIQSPNEPEESLPCCFFQSNIASRLDSIGIDYGCRKLSCSKEDMKRTL